MIKPKLVIVVSFIVALNTSCASTYGKKSTYNVFTKTGSEVPVLLRVDPKYPYQLHNSLTEGECSVTFDLKFVGTFYKPDNIRIEKCNSAFELACKDALYRWLFDPSLFQSASDLKSDLTTTCVYRINQ